MIEKIISGGQAGVDRAALDVAIALGIPHGGWCPKDRRADDGPIPEKYNLTETARSSFMERTLRNVVESDGTLILYDGSLTPGSQWTQFYARKKKRTHYLVDLGLGKTPQVFDYSLGCVRSWIEREGVKVLNVAGSRESLRPGIYEKARAFLTAVLTTTESEEER